MEQLALLWVVSRFKPAEAYAEGTKCACVRVHVLVCQGHARAGSPRHARLGHSATERMQMCWRRAGAGDARKIWSAALQSGQGSRCRAVVCCVRMCGLLREAASWPDGHLSCQSVRALLWIVCLSVVRWVKWPARAAWREQRAILTSRWPPPRQRQGRARRAFLPACVSGEGGLSSNPPTTLKGRVNHDD